MTDDATRRTLLALLAVAPASAAAATAPAPPSTIGIAKDRAALARHPGDACFLDEGARAGLFLRRPGPATADPLQGLYVPASTGHWARHWDGTEGQAEWFGAVANDPAVDCRPGIEAALALCIRVRLRPGTYHVADTLVSRVPAASSSERASTPAILPG